MVKFPAMLDSTANLDDPRARKQAGAAFWDDQPCGPRSGTMLERIAWYRRVEPATWTYLDSLPFESGPYLDVGCGQGLLLHEAARRAPLAQGVDMSRSSVRQAKENLAYPGAPAALPLVADAESLPYADNTFGLVTSIGVLHHTPNTEQGVRELVRVLRPGGNFVLLLYHRHSLKWVTAQAVRRSVGLVERLLGCPGFTVRRLRARYASGASTAHGTALLELLACPTFKAFSKREMREMCRGLDDLHILLIAPGFHRLYGFLPRPLQGPFAVRALAALDNALRPVVGFLLVAEGRKPAGRPLP